MTGETGETGRTGRTGKWRDYARHREEGLGNNAHESTKAVRAGLRPAPALPA
jgi:hypothetical protein